MSRIEDILKTGESARDEDAPAVTSKELKAAEEKLGFTFPSSYYEFAALGGFGELRISHRVLTPEEIIESLRYIDIGSYVPFADNGCGDYYCWQRSLDDEPRVYFLDHESEFEEVAADADSFAEWLAKNRF